MAVRLIKVEKFTRDTRVRIKEMGRAAGAKGLCLILVRSQNETSLWNVNFCTADHWVKQSLHAAIKRVFSFINFDTATFHLLINFH